MAKGLWAEALNDANKVIELDPLSPWGYERKHAALHKAGDYQSAVNAFEAMLSRMSESCDPQICALHRQYVNPEATRVVIRRAILDTIHNSPRVLIDTVSGQLCDKSEQAVSFELLPIFNNLVSSMTTHIDDVRIKQDVMQYYRYAMFSHTWEANEPLFDKVIRIVVYDLDDSPTHVKLKKFCKIVWAAGLHWAWSDTCCINKADDSALQEAIFARFKWYEGSALTVVFLCDVLFPPRRGDLTKSIWNSRAWTFQEYRTSKVVRFYTKDWKLYMNLDIPNHKESHEIISEMEEATGLSERALMALRPGSDDIWEKLFLASTRKTTVVEDVACSLLGMFSMSLPVEYGEGDHALGRLLAQLLTSSGDTSILAWTGQSGSFNSCLPGIISVFNQLPPSHIPLALPSSKMVKTFSTFHYSSAALTLIMNLYDRLNKLPAASFSGTQMKLPCLRFKLEAIVAARKAGVCVFHAQTDTVGMVEIRTEEDLFQFKALYFVHPWINFLLDRQPLDCTMEIKLEENTDGQSSSIGVPPPMHDPSNLTLAATKTGTARFSSSFSLPFDGTATSPKDVESLHSPSSLSEEDKETRALQVIARLKLPFGALLLAQNSGEDVAYRRVAANIPITIQVEQITLAVLKKLVSSVQVLDVL
ncbi:hypothetical protein V8E55_006606 [Tylopilus felleus]